MAPMLLKVLRDKAAMAVLGGGFAAEQTIVIRDDIAHGLIDSPFTHQL